MSIDTIRLLAKSKGGSLHILVGYVEGRDSVPFTSIKDAKKRVRDIGWDDIRVCISREWDDRRKGWLCSWDDQSKTFNLDGSHAPIIVDR